MKGVSETVFMFLGVGDETKMVDCSWCLKGDELIPSRQGWEMRKAVNEGVNDADENTKSGSSLKTRMRGNVCLLCLVG